MTSSINNGAAATLQLPVMLPSRVPQAASGVSSHNGEKTEELRQKFTQFVGEAFFGQMLKAMRATVGKPAYFYGGRAEEAFQGQLDQTMAEQLTKSSATKFAEPMFERQFPQVAASNVTSNFSDLSQLRRQ